MNTPATILPGNAAGSPGRKSGFKDTHAAPLPPALAAVAAPLAPAPRRETPAGGLKWPSPHHMRIIDPGAASVAERGLVTFSGGEKVQGIVTAIDFEAGQLEFHADIGPERKLPFGGFRSLYLARAIELEPVPMVLPPGGLEGKVSRARRVCTVTFKDGTALETDVVAVLQRKAGLFLFVPHYREAVLRWFVPAEVVLRHQLSGPEPAAAAPPANPDYLEGGATTRVGVEQALVRQKSLARRKLGEVLVRDKLITPAQRDEALVRQAGDKKKMLGEILVEMGAVSSDAIRHVLVEQLGVPAVNLTRFQYDPNAVKAITAELARKHLAMPLYRSDKRLAVAIDNPLSWQALHELEFFTGLKVDPAIAPREDLVAAIAQFYEAPGDGDKITQLLADLAQQASSAQPALDTEPVADSDNTLVRLVNKMIMDAFDQGASDIHIESRPGDKPSRVRFRVDGVLATYIEIPANFRAAMISRLKIMSELDISERRRPQDGKISFENFGARRIELRVVMMPTANGLEDVVMRILAAPRALTIDQLALSPRDLEHVKTIAGRSFGLLFVCGPTGSGKTTTLHSLLNHINTPQHKIWTVEDPIEITQEGLCQVQVNNKLGLSFAEVLRSFLRADPDVIMVGETRDPETARTVIAASLTGHLVFSTMHTNSAVESVLRLLDFGLDPFNFSDALLGVMGQRLVRKLCPACRTTHPASTQELQALAHEYCHDTALAPETVIARWQSRYAGPDGSIKLASPVGCAACDNTGYKGRMGVYELLVTTPAIKARVQARASAAELLQAAFDEGMVTLEQDALEKILQGHLDLKQVLLSCR